MLAPSARRAVSRKHVYTACFAIHFLIILTVCWRDVFALVASGSTVLPATPQSSWNTAESALSAALGERLLLANPARQAIASYCQASGIGFGYGFFAPNVPDCYKLVFELHYPDGRVEYELPRVATPGDGLRVSTLIDNVALNRYDSVRQLMVKMMTYSVWREHPKANMIRAVLGLVVLPGVEEYRRGNSESYRFVYAYDFWFNGKSQSH